MDERCKAAHAKLLSGKCPWCGSTIQAGKVVGQAANEGAFIDYRDAGVRTLEQLVCEDGVLDPEEAVSIVALIAKGLIEYQESIPWFGAICPRCVEVSAAGVTILNSAVCQSEESAHQENIGTIDKLPDVDYMAPELALQGKRIDGRADIYSLGCVFYFMLTGQPPFPNGSISERLLKHQVETPPGISQILSDAPDQLVQISERMMAKSPKQRYQSADELLSALDSLRS